MVVKLRLARLSKRHQPFYNIVVAKDRSARDSKPMEVLGTYNPVPQVPLAVAAEDSPAASISASGTIRRYKDIQLDITRTKYWLGVGAQPSEGVQGILGMLGLWEGKPGTREALGRKGGVSVPVAAAEVKSVEALPVDVASLIAKQRQRLKNKGA